MIKNKKTILFIIIAILAILAIVVCYNVFFKEPQAKKITSYQFDTNYIDKSDNVSTDRKGTRQNISKNIKKEYNTDLFLITNFKIVSMKTDYNEATVTFKVKNKTKDTLKNKAIAVDYLDKNGTRTNSILYIIPEIKPDEVLSIEESTTYRIIDSDSLLISDFSNDI